MDRQAALDALKALKRLLWPGFPAAADLDDWWHRYRREIQNAHRDLPNARAALVRSGYSPIPDTWLISSPWLAKTPADLAELARVGREIEAAILRLENESLAGSGATEKPAKLGFPTPDDSRLTHLERAERFGLNAESLRKKLDRWRKTNAEGWEEIKDAQRNQPKYVYVVGAIRHLLTR